MTSCGSRLAPFLPGRLHEKCASLRLLAQRNKFGSGGVGSSERAIHNSTAGPINPMLLMDNILHVLLDAAPPHFNGLAYRVEHEYVHRHEYLSVLALCLPHAVLIASILTRLAWELVKHEALMKRCLASNCCSLFQFDIAPLKAFMVGTLAGRLPKDLLGGALG